MANRIERLTQDHDGSVDTLYDALGFNGDIPKLEITDYVLCAEKLLPTISTSDEYRRYIRASLSDEFQRLRDNGYSDGAMASYLLGAAVWKITVHGLDKEHVKTHRRLIDRSLQNVRLSRQRFGYGSERNFHLGFANYTQQFGDMYDTTERRRLYGLCRYSETSSLQSARSLTTADYESEKPNTAWLPHVLSALATIAMVQGYSIQPPDHQRGEDGSWQLPKEYENGNESDDE